MHRYVVNKREPWTKFLEAWQELGFKIAYHNQFECHDVVTDEKTNEEEMILYRDSFIVYMNSYTNEDGKKCVNRSHLYGEAADNRRTLSSLNNDLYNSQYYSVKYDDSGNIIIESFNPHLHFYHIVVLINRCQPLNTMSHSYGYLCFINYAEAENLGIYTKEDLQKAKMVIGEINRLKIDAFTIQEAKAMITGKSR